jgi:superfamily II RNA helicase
MQFKGFTLDKFQEDAVHSIEENRSVIVSAATGTGKTLIADYAIDKFLKLKKRVIYTAPIKALSNQKYRDFKEDYGEDAIGIMTGDVVINPGAPILIMTTEIYRNMLLTNDPTIESLSYVIFDEIHFISDIERGTVWEESIIFSPQHIRFLALSATIPNAHEFAEWIESIHRHKVDVIEYRKRAVPLKHYLYDREYGIVTMNKMKEVKELDKYPSYKYIRGRSRRRAPYIEPPSHIELVLEMNRREWLPCIFFTFSRKACESKATELSKRCDFTTKEEKAKIIGIFNNLLDENIKGMDSVRLIKGLCSKGIAVHHAGILPNLKEIVETLFGEGMIKVLYATETFAVGINMPAKSVAFNTLTKFDGVNFRYLYSKEYFQLAGRAGRRGIDTFGNAIAMFDRQRDDIHKIEKFTTRDTDPIISQFRLTVNTVINLIDKHTDEEIEKILRSNFDFFLKQKSQKQVRIMSTYNRLVKKLTAMGYIEGKQLTEKGRFLTRVYANELLIGEIFFSKSTEHLTPTDICLIIAAINYEKRRGTRFEKNLGGVNYHNVMKAIRNNRFVMKHIDQTNLLHMEKIVRHWVTGGDFEDLMEMSSLAEGDYIRIFRQIVDTLRQLRHSTQNYELLDKVNKCIELVQRDVVAVSF